QIGSGRFSTFANDNGNRTIQSDDTWKVSAYNFTRCVWGLAIVGTNVILSRTKSKETEVTSIVGSRRGSGPQDLHSILVAHRQCRQGCAYKRIARGIEHASADHAAGDQREYESCQVLLGM